MARKLRIAFSVTCGIVCLLLIALWVRSYRASIKMHVGDFSVVSCYGRIDVQVFDDPRGTFAWPYQPLFKVRHSVLVFATAALGTATWAPWSNRFSLRTLLIATTLVAVALGLIVWAAR